MSYITDLSSCLLFACLFSSAAHSFILNLAGKRCEKVFSQDQLKAIENEHLLPLPTLLKELTDFLNKYKNAVCISINMYIKLSRKYQPTIHIAMAFHRMILTMLAKLQMKADSIVQGYSVRIVQSEQS